MKRFALLAAVLFAVALHADDKYANLNFLVVSAENGKPIRNASIVLHPVTKDGRQKHAGSQLKTDPDGKASFSGAPFGKLRVQVLVRGFQTYGEDFQIHQSVEEITIKLKRPQGQYSIYDNKPKQDEKPK